MKKVFSFFFPFLFIFACQQSRKDQLTIAAAANTQFVMQEIVKTFEEKTKIPCDMIVGSSGKLTAQIKEGAPFDLFLSANRKYPKELYRSGLCTKEPGIYAFGKLVLWSMKIENKPDIDILKEDQIQHIALANPKTAPYGEAAIEVLKYYNLYETLESKLVYGESISQTNQFIVSKTAELGFTAKSVVLSPKIKSQGKWIEIDEKTYSPIAQGVVIIKNGKVEKAKQFYEFLFSQEAKTILEKYGYSF